MNNSYQRKNKLHTYIPEMVEQLRIGQITRREFLRTATLLGVSVGTASTLAACAPEPAPELAVVTYAANSTANLQPTQKILPTNSPPQQADQPATPVMTEPPLTNTPVAVEQSTGEISDAIQRGGTLSIGMLLQNIEHPAALYWLEGGNIIRHVAEYLTETGADSITRPQLLERWEANDDVSVWTLHLKRNIYFNDRQPLTTEDVLFTMEEWFNPLVNSSMQGLLGYLGGMQNVELIDDYTMRLYLDSPNIGLPEHLFHYPAVILPRTFEGDFLRQPIGTGPFILAEYAEGERATLQARNDYWQMGEDGDPLPYLDQIVYLSIDKDASVGAIQSGQIDTFNQPRPADWQALKDIDSITATSVGTSAAYVLRMRTDVEPWTDQRVINALKMCQDREQILQMSYFGEGDVCGDAHVAPSHPTYNKLSLPKYNPDGARELLEEWANDTGNSLPLRVSLVSKNDEAEPEIATTLKQLAEPAGFDIALDITAPGGYWDRWADVPLGITPWSGRPLSTMLMRLAYVADEDGNPVVWNETRWVDPEFVSVLEEAERTLDISARKKLIGRLQEIFQDRGPIGISFFKRTWRIARANVHNITAHPSQVDLFHSVWKSS